MAITWWKSNQKMMRFRGKSSYYNYKTRTNYFIILWCLRYFLTYHDSNMEERGERHRSSVRWRLMIKIIPVFLLIAPEVSSERTVTLQPAILIFCKICRFLCRWVFSDEQRVIQSKFWCWYDGGLREVTGRHCIIVALWPGTTARTFIILSPVSPQSLHYPRYHFI